MSEVLELIHKVNNSIFIKNKYKIYLYVYETPIKRGRQYNKEYKKKFPLNIKILKPEFESILRALIHDLRVKTITNTHDIKFCMVIDHNETDEDGDNEESKTDNMVSNENVIDKLLNSSNTSNLEPSDTDAEDMQFSEKNIRYAKNSPSEKKNAISHHETNKYASPEKSKDDGYDWILKQAQAARYKKQISKKQKINDEEFTVSFIDNDDNPEKQDGDEGSKFYHYFAVPALVRQNDIPPNNGIQEEEKDEYSLSFMKESHSSQFGFYHDRPKVQQNDNEASFNTVKKAYFTMNNNKSQDYEYQMPGLYDDKYNDNKQSHEMFAQDPDLQQEAIGEILFKSSRLKGFKKIYYIYMFLTSSLRFI